jgi:hypothetical protein
MILFYGVFQVLNSSSPEQFFLSAMGIDANAPAHGKESLEEFFRQQKASKNGLYNSA